MSWKSPLGGGNPGAFTCSVYRLDPLGIIPIEPLFDLIPGLTPLRVTFDMIDSEDISQDYELTEHPVQASIGVIDITSNIRRRMKGLTIVGTMAATPQSITKPFVPGFPGPQATPDFSLLGGDFFQPSMPPMPPTLIRLDLLRIENLEKIAEARRPVMVVTPRVTLGRCAITSISRPWSPDMGESTMVSVSFREIRIVSAIPGLPQPDFAAMAPGNNATTNGGATAAQTGTTATASGTAGVAPQVGGQTGSQLGAEFGP